MGVLPVYATMRVVQCQKSVNWTQICKVIRFGILKIDSLTQTYRFFTVTLDTLSCKSTDAINSPFPSLLLVTTYIYS